MIATQLTLSHADTIALKITDAYSLHRVVYDLFEDVRSNAEKCASIPSGIIYVDKGWKANFRKILILSDRFPKSPIYGNLKSQIIPDSFLSHQHYLFEIVINPTKRDSKTGKTVAVVGNEAVGEWFSSKAEQSWGFTIVEDSLRVEKIDVQKFSKSNHQITQSSARLLGELCVVDKEKFIKSFKQGIGRGRAFGFGFLQIVPSNI